MKILVSLRCIFILIFVIACATNGVSVKTTETIPPPVPSPTESSFALRCSIVFVDEYNGQVDIYSVYSDGTQLRQITDDSAREMWPVWSPDGTKLAYQNYAQDRSNPEIFVMSSDGRKQVNLTKNHGDDWSPAWSPDGKRSRFTRKAQRVGQFISWNPTVQI